MIPTKNLSRIALCLILIFTAFTITLTNATTENNYNTDNNFLTNISQSIHTENGYKANIIINPHITGIYAQENGYKLDLTINTQGIGGSLKENNYKLDLTPEKTFPDIPDIAITKIVTSKTVVGQGYSILISLTVSNQALNYETFHVIIYANTTIIKTQTLTLTSGNSTTITFTWNTTGFAKGNYTISAYAWPVDNESDLSDNTFTDGSVRVVKPGDINGDNFVNYLDGILLGAAFSSKPGDTNWNPNSDLNDDGYINYLDGIILGAHFGQTDP
jgi:hypothetical protein